MSVPRILLGVTGGIAAYKAAELVRALVKEGAEVQCVLTGRAEEFVTPTTLAALSERPVLRTEFEPEGRSDILHIDAVRWADALVVAPATGNTLARFAQGLADDLLSTIYLAFDGPVVVAPAMNPRMWDAAETRSNIERLALRGVEIVEPEAGYMACGDEGSGRLAELPLIVAASLRASRRTVSLEGRKVVVSAGPTYEPIDPVRFIGNRSSGKMGFAIAAAARARGAETLLVSGPTSIAPPWGVAFQPVETAEQMKAAIFAAAPEADAIVMSAAVADHRPDEAAARKISRKEPYSIALVPNPDILRELVLAREAAREGRAEDAGWKRDQLIVGFAAETHDFVERGRAKRERKGCDLLLANDVTAPGAGFSVDTNVVTLIRADGSAESWPQLTKREVAERLWDSVESLQAETARQ